MSSSNCSFLTCIQISQDAGKVVWYSHLFKNFPQFVVIPTVKGFGMAICTTPETSKWLSLFIQGVLWWLPIIAIVSSAREVLILAVMEDDILVKGYSCAGVQGCFSVQGGLRNIASGWCQKWGRMPGRSLVEKCWDRGNSQCKALSQMCAVYDF